MDAHTDIDRPALIRQVENQQAANDAWIRRQVIENDRLDILAVEVLGYELQPFHLALQRHMMRHRETLTLAFRGCGKSTVLTVTGTLHELVKDPNTRICLASKTEGYAKKILSEVKQHLEGNETFRRIFGDLEGDSKWNENEIVIATRTRAAKEASVTAVGIGGQVTGMHFKVIFGDDLVDEDNSRTKHSRTRTRKWYYTALDPTLDPGGRRHIIGTRYHFDDLYGHFETHEFAKTTQVIPALDEFDRSPWPSRFPVSWFEAKRESAGLIIFNCQYQCDTEAMKGEVFHYDDIDLLEASDVPEDIRGFAGFDLAIKTQEANDRFAGVAIGTTSDGHIYILTSYTRHLRFSAQTDKIEAWWEDGCDGWFAAASEGDSRLVEFGVEDNAYQDAQIQNCEDRVDGIRVRPVRTLKDKRTRAMKLANYFERGKVHVVGHQPKLLEQLVLFPNGDFDDLFDALDIAVTVAFRRRRKKRGRGSRGRVSVI